MQTIAIASRIFILIPRSSERGEYYPKEIQAQLGKIGLNMMKIGNLIIAHNADVAHIPADNQVLLVDVFPGTTYYLKNIWTSIPCDAEKSRQMLERDAQVYNLINFHSGGFTIYSDFLGIKPLHVFETDHYIAIASKIIDLRDVLNISLTETDPLAIAELVYFGTPLENRTLHKRIQRFSAVGHTRWSQDEGFVQQDKSLPDPIASISLRQASYQANEAFFESVRDRLDRHNSPNLIALSGGFDSRLIAAKLKELEAPVRAYSYGQPYHTEIKVAKKVAKSLKIDHVLIPYALDNYIRNIHLHVEAMEGQCETHSTQMCNLLRINADSESTLFIGFFGDSLQGEHLSWLKDEHYHSLDSVAKGIFLYHSDENRNALISRLGLPITRDDILHALYLSLGKKNEGYFAFLLWDWNHRQRRYVGSHFALLGTKFRVIAPYYDPRVINAWASLPRIALEKRYLFREILKTYHPALTEIPHTYERRAITHNIRAELSLLWDEWPRQILRKLRLMEMVKRVVPWRAPSIHRLSRSATSFKQRQDQIEKIKDSKPYLKDELSLSIDYRIFDAYMNNEELTRSQLAVLRKLFGFSAYATWLAGNS